jgi:positive regulator of sigma E activity
VTLKAVLLAYGLPLVFTLLGAGFAFSYWQSDLATAIGAGVSLVIAVLVVYRLRGADFIQRTRPRIVGVVLP